jgi:hypothetical protein
MNIQFRLTPEEYTILSEYGQVFGYSVPKTIKYFLGRIIEDLMLHNELFLPSLEERKLQMIEKMKRAKPVADLQGKQKPKRSRPTIKKPFSAKKYFQRLEETIEQ